MTEAEHALKLYREEEPRIQKIVDDHRDEMVEMSMNELKAICGHVIEGADMEDYVKTKMEYMKQRIDQLTKLLVRR